MLLQKRSNGIYYFRWSYPPVLRKLLGKRELIKSLHTSSKAQAFAKAGAYFMAVNRIKEQMAKLKLEGSVKSIESEIALFDQCGEDLAAGKISASEFAEIAYEMAMPHFYDFLVDSAKVYSPNNYTDMIQQRESLGQLLTIFQDAATNKAGEIADGVILAELILEQINLDHDNEDAISLVLAPFIRGLKIINDTDLKARLGNDLAVMLHQSVEILNERLSSQNAKPRSPSFAFSQAQVLTPSTKELNENIHNKSEVMRFSELFKEFLAHKIKTENLTEKMQNDYRDYVKTYLVAMTDQPIDLISKREIKAFLLDYAKLPKRNLKAYKNKPISELWGMAVPEEHRIASRTMLGIKKFLMGVFRFAVNQDYLTVSPTVDLDMKIKLEKVRGPFTDPEVRQIFEAVNHKAKTPKYEWQKWAVLFGAYTGARASEVMGLCKEDIRIDGESGLWSVVVRGTKTRNALREFPLPPELIDKGFLSFVGTGSGRIFPADKSDKAITSFFPNVLKKSGVPKLNNKGLTRSFHSFRHSVITKARGANFEESLVQQIVGHEKTGAGITDTYTHDFTARQLFPVVNEIRY